MPEPQRRDGETFVLDGRYIRREAVAGFRNFFLPITALVNAYRVATRPDHGEAPLPRKRAAQ